MNTGCIYAFGEKCNLHSRQATERYRSVQRVRRFGKKRQSRFYRVYAKQFRPSEVTRTAVKYCRIMPVLFINSRESTVFHCLLLATDRLSSNEIVRCYTLTVGVGLLLLSCVGFNCSWDWSTQIVPSTIALLAWR